MTVDAHFSLEFLQLQEVDQLATYVHMGTIVRSPTMVNCFNTNARKGLIAKMVLRRNARPEVMATERD